MTVYDLLAPVYGSWAALTESSVHRRVRLLARQAACEKLLEAGIGTGTEYAGLAGDAGRSLCVGIDLSAAMLKRASRSFNRIHGARGEMCRADVRALPFGTGSFDCVLSSFVIDLLPESDIPITLREFHRVLRRGGTLVLAVMGEQPPVLQGIWMLLYRLLPALVGGCRPVHAAERLRVPDWSLEGREMVIQNGFRSEVLVARGM